MERWNGKSVLLIIAVVLSLALTNCEKYEDPALGFKIEGLTADNFPRLDGSTSNEPLSRIIACKLLGYNYRWENLVQTYTVLTDDQEINTMLYDLVKTSQTHNAIVNLIDGNADIILSARKLSPDENAYAEAEGVTLIETPIALDAFIFIVNPNNPIRSLTHGQIVDIYTEKTVNWEKVGGFNREILPYVRNQESGSQELMESLVMQGTAMPEFSIDYDYTIFSMLPVFHTIRNTENAICYTVYYYKERMVAEEYRNTVKTIAVNGITPNRKTILNRQYPFVAEVYATVRSDLDKNSMAYKLYKLLQTDAGKSIIAESGYIPY
jgi:phosphate transport system substrate-binding protein